MGAPHVNYPALGNQAKQLQTANRELVSEAMDADVVAKIRHCVNTGLVPGTDTFRDQASAMLS